MNKEPKEFSKILVLDDLLTKKEAVEFHKHILNQPIWYFGRKSEVKGDEYPFWGTEFHTGLIEPKIKVIIDRVNQRLAKTTLRSLKSYSLIRIDGNGATVGSSGYPHHDNLIENAVSLLIYGNPEWKAAWGGETKFFDSSRREVIRSVMPKFGRVVLFPSRLPHAAAPTTPIFKSVRLTLSLVFIPEKKNSTKKWKATARVRPERDIVISKTLDQASKGIFHIIMKRRRFMASLQLNDTIAAMIERIWKELSPTRSVPVGALSKKTGIPRDELVQYLSILARYRLVTKTK